jgi:hypothetical protein
MAAFLNTPSESKALKTAEAPGSPNFGNNIYITAAHFCQCFLAGVLPTKEKDGLDKRPVLR